MLDEAELKRQLLTVAARGSDAAAAFERLYRAAAPVLFGIALRIVRRREVADELLHDAFTRIWHDAARFDPHGTAVGWLTTIVRNRAIDVMASHDVSRVNSYHDLRAGDGLDDNPEAALDRLFDWPDADGEDARLDARRSQAFLRRCLGELQASERQSLVLAYEHGLSHGDLAAHLNKPLGTVKTWVRRGLDNLRKCVEHCMGVAT
jgi:RNA polymerase sigma-70 factor (ECF subfamily)